MATIKKFKDIEFWKLARELCNKTGIAGTRKKVKP